MEADCISQIEDNPVVRKYTSLTTIELEQLSTNSTERSKFRYPTFVDYYTLYRLFLIILLA